MLSFCCVRMRSSEEETPRVRTRDKDAFVVSWHHYHVIVCVMMSEGRDKGEVDLG